MDRNYEICIKENKIRPVSSQDDRSIEIIKLVKHRKEFWELVKKEANNYPTILIEAYYEIIKELLTALAYKDGFICETHDCLFYYIEKAHTSLEIDFPFLHELRKTRNAINYRGTTVKNQRGLISNSKST